MRSALTPDMLVIGLGGNVGTEAEIRERFVRAREAFRAYSRVWSASLYRTAPVGPSQGSFLNTAVRLRIEDATPEEVIAFVLEIERLLGRDRRAEERWGPRTLDLDVLVWGDRVLRTPALELPHPRVAERRFALRPLIDLVSADAVLPGSDDKLGALEALVRDQLVEEIATEW